MHVNAGTSATQISTAELVDNFAAGQVVVLQNLGPGDLYVDFASNVTTSSGLKIGVNGSYEFPRTSDSQQVYMIASAASTDVRILLVD